MTLTFYSQAPADAVDNGGFAKTGGSNYPLRGEKNTLFEGGIKAIGFLSGAPLLVTNSSGRVNQLMLHITDWYPTIVALAGGTTSQDNVDGLDIWKAVTGYKKTSQNC